MNLDKTGLLTIKENEPVPIGSAFTTLGGVSGDEKGWKKVSLLNDDYVDLDFVIDAAMPAGTVINLYFYRGDTLLETSQVVMGAKGAAGTYSERLTGTYIQKAEYCVPEVKLQQGGASYNATIFLTALKREDSLDLQGVATIPFTVEFTIGIEAAQVINVACQIKDFQLAGMAAETPLQYYLSSDAAGDTPVTADTDISIGTNGVILHELVADRSGIAKTNATGQIDLDIEDTGVLTHYLNIILPDRIITSTAITFA